MSDEQQTSVDQSGVNRTETGEIAPPPTEKTEQKTEAGTSQQQTNSQQQEPPKPEGEKTSLLNEKSQGAPEAYEDFKVPEGYELDPEVAKEAGTIFKDLNLTQDAAQRLVNFYVAKSQEAAQQPIKVWEKMQKDWQDQVRADPEVGNKIDEVKVTVARALDGLGDAKLVQEFRNAMDMTGAGNHPAFFKTFYKMALALTEGKHVPGSKPSPLGQQAPGERRTAAQAMYPNLP